VQQLRPAHVLQHNAREHKARRRAPARQEVRGLVAKDSGMRMDV